MIRLTSLLYTSAVDIKSVAGDVAKVAIVVTLCDDSQYVLPIPQKTVDYWTTQEGVELRLQYRKDRTPMRGMSDASYDAFKREPCIISVEEVVQREVVILARRINKELEQAETIRKAGPL